MLKKIVRAVDTVSEWVGKIDSFLLVAIIVATFYEVVVRYIFKNPTSWSNELCQHMFAIYMMLGGAYVLKHKAHICMDILSSHFSPKTKALVDVLTFFLGALFLVVLIWKGGKTALISISTNEHSTSVWAPTLIPFKACLPVGCFLFLLQYVAEFIRNLVFLITGEQFEDTKKSDDVAELVEALGNLKEEEKQ